MENRFLVTLLCSVSLTIGLTSADVLAEQRQQIRFYKANTLLQTSRIAFAAKKGRQQQCQNLPVRRRIYQVNQIGFAGCRLFLKKNCDPESLVAVKRKKDATPVFELTQGFAWFPISEHKRGVKLRSWHCQGDAARLD